MPHEHQEKILNPEQEKAVHFGFGPLLIIAGAGTGKTTVITERIKYLISSQLAKPGEILALTFTEKAAREMEERIDIALPYGYTNLWISTFHSFCDRILRAEAIHVGLNPGYRLLGESDATLLLRKNLFSLDLDYFRPLGNPTKFIAGLLGHFSRLQDEDVTSSEYFQWVKIRNEEDKLEIKKLQELASAYKFYEDLKIRENVMDFGDLITNALELFRQRKNVLTQYQKQFKFFLVDEFQDTNIAQYELIKLLAPPKKKPNLTVVGDDNQSVYKFRGAAVSNILFFKKDYKGAHQVVLNKNYRSYQYLLDSAYTLIKHNDPDTLEAKLGISKKLVSERNSKEKTFSGNEEIKVIHTDRVENEADEVAKEIKKFVDQSSKIEEKKYTCKDFAILVRANNHAEPFVRAFIRHGIPYQFLGPGQLFRQPEVKELICYLQVLSNFADNVALFKVLSMEYFDYSPRDLIAIANFAKKYNQSLFEACEAVVEERVLNNIRLPQISNETKEKLSLFIKMVNRHLKLLTRETAGQILYYFLEDSGMIKNILNYEFPLDERKALNITKFFNKLKTYEAEHEDALINTVLDWILLALELGESPLAGDVDWIDNDAVNILTVHSSKGLEFKVVFLVNLVSQRFPTIERREQIPIAQDLIKEKLPEGDYHLEEERRLFYVGMTRARDLLYFTAANYYGEGKREKKISPFVFETLGDKMTSQNLISTKQLSILDWHKTKEEKPLTKQISSVTYLSYSQIETFKLCPLHYKLRYILKIQPPPSAAISFGSSIHAALKDFYLFHQEGKNLTKKKLIELLKTNWVREGYSSKHYEEQMFQRGIKYLEDFFDKDFSPEAKTILLEQSFTVPIKTSKRFIKIGGRIDRVDNLGDNKIEIIDYKTGKLPSKRELNTNMQLSLYAIAASEIPEPPFHKKPEDVILTLYYFDTQEKISTTRTKDQLEKEKENIIAVASEIEHSNFRCSGNKLCENCEYKMFCGAV